MQGKDTFSTAEAAQIRSLLREKARSDSDEQKKIRRQMRGLGFYITNYDGSYSGFTLSDFETLVVNGRIKVVAK